MFLRKIYLLYVDTFTHTIKHTNSSSKKQHNEKWIKLSEAYTYTQHSSGVKEIIKLKCTLQGECVSMTAGVHCRMSVCECNEVEYNLERQSLELKIKNTKIYKY